MVILVEIMRKNFLASIVPVIVNAVLNAHQIVVDIVAFVSRGDFPRSRLGEKQRGKILASWVTRKMRTIAQFGIKDPGSAESDLSDAPFPRRSGPSFRSGSVKGGSSLKQVESSSALADLQERDYAPLSTDISEMPGADDNSILESSPAPETEGEDSRRRGDSTPTAMRPSRDASFQYPNAVEMPADDFTARGYGPLEDDDAPTPPPKNDIRTLPYLNLPSVDGRGSLMPYEEDDFKTHAPSKGGGGLRVANQGPPDDERDYRQGVTMHSNLASRSRG